MESTSVAALDQPLQRPAGAATLHELVHARHRELEARFAQGTATADDFLRISGTPRGRVLNVPALESLGLTALVRAYCGSRLFPWDGKSFSARGQAEGRGVNRWRHPLRGDAFQFRTALSASRIDGRPCISIDYDVPETPRPIRATYDELRTVGPGLQLGRGMMRLGGTTPSLILWFLVDTQP